MSSCQCKVVSVSSLEVVSVVEAIIIVRRIVLNMSLHER